MNTCKICDKKIEKYYQGQLYCGTECRYIAYKARLQKKKRVDTHCWDKRKCLLCDKEYMPRAKNQKYCSTLCCSKIYETDYVSKNLSLIEKKKIDNFSIRWLKVRIKILDRDGFRCQYCGRSPKKDKEVVLHIDHKIPKQKGGNDDLDNLITSCAQCNLGKSDVLLKYWGEKRYN